MMRFLVIFSFIFCVFVLKAQLVVSPSVSVSETTGFHHPQMELNTLNEPMITWTDGNSKNVYFSKKVINTFSSPLVLNTGVLAQSYAWSGPDLCVENEKVYVVFRSDGYETGNVYLTKSLDNGTTFSAPTRVDYLTEGYAQYPDISVLNDTVFVTYMQHDANSANPRYVLSRSFDGGATFEQPIVAGALTGNEACDCCPPDLVVTDEYVIILFRNNNSNIRDIKGVISYDRGATFTQIAEIDTHNWMLMSCPSTGPDGKINTQTHSLHTVYKTMDNNVNKVFLNTYDLNQSVSNATIDLSENLTNPNYPQLALSGDTIGIVLEGLGTSTDIFFTHSYTGVNGINTSNRINLTNAQGAQSKPDVAFRNGAFHVVYVDGTKLKYVQLNETASLNELKIENNKMDLIYSKSSPNPSINLAGKKCFSLAGQEMASNLLNLPTGTYYVLDKQTIQKLIILP